MTKKRIYGTGDPLDYVPFNIDNLPRDKKARQIFADVGLTSWRDLFADWDIVHTDNLEGFRHNAYNTPQEIVKRFEAAIHAGLVRILYNYQTGMYHAYVYNSDAGAK